MPPQLFRAALAFGAVVLLVLIYTFRGPRERRSLGGDSDIFDEYETRIVALGDLHADLKHALRTLRMSGVIDEHRMWTGDVDILVQTGDIIDRGDDTLAIYSLMDDLRTQARAVGGDVLSHLGNHEYMNAIGDWRYVYPSEIKTFGTVSKRQTLMASGWLGNTWRSNYTVTSRLPLHPSLGPPNTDYDPSNTSPLSHAALPFVHGGISPSYLAATPYPSRINALGSSLLHKRQNRKQPPPHPPNPYPGLPDDATQEEHDLYGANGPLWYRGWALDDESKVCAEVDGVLEKLGVRRMVVGHTLNFEHIVVRCGGKIIIIDTGMSSAYGGVLSALDVRYSLKPVEEDLLVASGSNSTHPLAKRRAQSRSNNYVEKETIYAVYEHHRDLILSESREVDLGES